MWKKIWNIKVPNKMKILLWRFAHNCLPSGEQLQRRHVPTRTDCVFCGRAVGVEHALLFCVHARLVWEEIKEVFGLHLCHSSFMSPKQWIFELLGRCLDGDISVITVTLWHIWEARNGARNEPDPPHPKRTVARARAYVDMIFQHLFKPAAASRCESSASGFCWSPSPRGTLLVSSNAAVSSECASRWGWGCKTILASVWRLLPGFCLVSRPQKLPRL